VTKTTRRVLLSLLLSTAGFAGTFAWYRLTEVADTPSNETKKIARLVSIQNDVQKKMNNKIIWQNVSENEILRVGESIRTAPDAEARLEFFNSQTAIDLEPDSAIVLEENNGDISLDFIKGNILIKSNNNSPLNTDTSFDETSNGKPPSLNKTLQKITLKNGTQNFDIKNTELSLGKDSSGELNVQVMDGDASSLTSLKSEEFIHVFRPLPGDVMYISPLLDEPITINWKPLANTYKVSLFSGEKRNRLSLVEGTASGEKGELRYNLKSRPITEPSAFGKKYFQIIAEPSDKMLSKITSSIFRIQIRAKIPPLLLTPGSNELVELKNKDQEIHFLWNNTSSFSKSIIEISNSSDLKSPLKIAYLNNTNDFNFNIKNEGNYYWRVSGIIDKHDEVISSPIGKFRVKVINELPSPVQLYPKDKERIIAAKLQTERQYLTWISTEESSGFKIQIYKADGDSKPLLSGKLTDATSKESQFSIKNLNAGTYAWRIAAISNNNKSSEFSPFRTFIVTSTPLLQWVDTSKTETQKYFTKEPIIKLKWIRSSQEDKTWRIKITSALDNKIIQTTASNTPEADVNVPADGIYTVIVDALDKADTLLAQSSPKEISVSQAPLLNPPSFAPEISQNLVSTGAGDAEIKWIKVNEAKLYYLNLKDSTGVEKKMKFETVVAKLSNLMPGEYSISLQSVDEHGRESTPSSVVTLKVPQESNVRAPKLKGVKIQ
jgi:hypothetical protein